MEVIIGVDPGKTTGIALWSHNVGPSFRQIEGADHAVDWLADMARSIGHAVFVVEKFTITTATAKMTAQHDPIEITGAIKYLCRQHGHKIIQQTPAEAKSFVGMPGYRKLKAMSWHTPGQDHANDAAAHLLLYCAKQHYIPFEDML